MRDKPTKAEILKATDIIRPFVHHTPVLQSSYLNRLTGAGLYFKCENFQKVGAFKMRGAAHAIYHLMNTSQLQGVATHSSGNHAQAVALAAQMNNIPAHIVMPKNAPKIKSDAVRGYGAKIYWSENTQLAREQKLEEVLGQVPATFIHPYDDYTIIAGQATATLELIQEAPPLDAIIAPIGGGGLMSGAILAAQYLSPLTKMYGAEPIAVNDATESLRQNKRLPPTGKDTIADGLKTGLGERNSEIILDGIYDIFEVEEHEILTAMMLVWQRMKVVIEPSSAVVLAAIIKNKSKFQDKAVGLIFSGGNVDFIKILIEISKINSIQY